MKILVSACLLGRNCKYDGGNNYNADLVEMLKGHEITEVCPEVLGGLPTPRIPAEIVNGKVVNREGISVDKEFRQGAQIALEIAKREGVDMAILQSRSPSCGVGLIYDGTFKGGKKEGNGVFVRMLMEEGIKVVDVAELKNIPQ